LARLRFRRETRAERGAGVARVKALSAIQTELATSAQIIQKPYSEKLGNLVTTSVAGCIIGRALYEGQLTLKDALEASKT